MAVTTACMSNCLRSKCVDEMWVSLIASIAASSPNEATFQQKYTAYGIPAIWWSKSLACYYSCGGT